MRLSLLICLTLVAFASNSVLNRMAVGEDHIDAASFAVLRVASGAIALSMLAWKRMRFASPGRLVGTLSLGVYMVGFSLAYRTLDAGLGALILFGTVQIGMFGWTAYRGSQPTLRQLIGASIAFGGLTLVLWPGQNAQFGSGAVLMVFAGLGWAAYTLAGKGTADPLAETGANFVMVFPLVLVLLLMSDLQASLLGVALAVVSGAVTSGLGYALWYSILPRFSAQNAAVLQLCVPVLAISGGAFLLGEVLSWQLGLSAVLVIGGIALALTSQPVQADRK